jgi:hypothetical protein
MPTAACSSEWPAHRSCTAEDAARSPPPAGGEGLSARGREVSRESPAKLCDVDKRNPSSMKSAMLFKYFDVRGNRLLFREELLTFLLIFLEPKTKNSHEKK